jgi:acetyl-CoA synthetase
MPEESISSKPILIPPMVSYLIRKAQEDPVKFWDEVAKGETDLIYWKRLWDKTFEWEENKPYRWFIGGITNAEYSHIDFPVEKGFANKAIYIYENAELGITKTYTYYQFLDLVKRYAASMRALGIKKGDRITVYMPTKVESIAVFHAAARIGAIATPVFAGFSAGALRDRILLTEPKLLFTQDFNMRRGKLIGLKDIVDDALKGIEKPTIEKVIVLKSGYTEKELSVNPKRDMTFEEFLSKSKEGSSDVEWMESNDPLYIIPTSGTTAKPKPVVHKHGPYQVYVTTMSKWVYGTEPSDVWFNTSDVGWVVGMSYIVYGIPIFGATSIVYDGVADYPKPDMWWEIIEKNRVTKLWLSPTGIRLLGKYGTSYAKKHDLSSLKAVFSAGELLNPEPLKWLMYDVLDGRVPVIDHMWQTETGGPVVGNPYGIQMLPIKPGSAGILLPGLIGYVANEETGLPAKPGEKGVLVIKHPFPGYTSELWQDYDRYIRSYWNARPQLKGVIYTGDGAMVDEDNYIWFVGRVDDVIKISAHRIGSYELESALVSHPAVAEAAVIGVPDPIRGEVAVGFVVLKEGYQPNEKIREELEDHVKKVFGPVAVFKTIEFVKAVPKTRSGKIMRRVIRAVYKNEPLGDISTLEDEAEVEEIKKAIEQFKQELKERES